MSGVRPIEIIIHTALCEQAPTDNMNNYFRMAELLTNIKIKVVDKEKGLY